MSTSTTTSGARGRTLAERDRDEHNRAKHTGTKLSAFEHGILDELGGSWDFDAGLKSYTTPTALVVYVDDLGVQVGLARGAVRYTVDGEPQEYFEVSPVPGAWAIVRRSQIIKVRHGGEFTGRTS